MENLLCCFHETATFQKIINALKPFVQKNAFPSNKAMICLEGDKQSNTMTAWSCDGHTLARESIKSGIDIYGDFSVYVGVPEIGLAVFKHQPANLYRVSETRVSFAIGFVDNEILTMFWNQPEIPQDYKVLYAKLRKQDAQMLHIGVNPFKLATAARSMQANAGPLMPPVVLSISDQYFEPIRIASIGVSSGTPDSERYILPVRTRLPEDNLARELKKQVRELQEQKGETV